MNGTMKAGMVIGTAGGYSRGGGDGERWEMGREGGRVGEDDEWAVGDT